LPNSQRIEYYDTKIRPVLATEERLAEEERDILVKAQQGGIEIPWDLSESINKR
jgi:hypothetical protein